MNLLREKMERLSTLERRVSDFNKAIRYAKQRLESGKDAVGERFAVWSECGNHRATLNAADVLQSEELIELLSRRINEAEVEINKIRPVVQMAERVLKAEEEAA